MDLTYLKINKENCESDVGKVLQNVIIRQTMKQGGWIAGGFARAVAHSVFNINNAVVKDYLIPNCDEWGNTSTPAGDVDVFSPVDTDLSEHDDGCRSYGGFATNSRCLLDSYTGSGYNDNSKRYTVQLVDHPEYRYNSVEDCLMAFDIINSRYAIVLKDNAYHLVYDKTALKLDRSGYLDIAHTSGPFLACRVLKYLIHRKCSKGITQHGYDKLTEWFSRAAAGIWPKHFYGHHLISISSHVRAMRAYGYMKIDNLVLFLGKWRHRYKEEMYGPVIEIDWAVHEIGIIQQGE
ncbi:MAG: hypothetical protein H8E12_09015 [Rhodobacteraceae bacterium]|nr:hypothetical protein [Paracoccaceae bacterium]